MGPQSPAADGREDFVTRKQQSLCAFSEQGATFDNLYQLLETPHWIRTALARVLQNAGSRTPGVDGKTKADYVNSDQREALVQEIVTEMREKRYHASPVRRVYIPKASDPTKLRPLGVPTLKDKCVQEAVRMILEPIYEPRFHPHSYGFRPFRSAHHALARIHLLATLPNGPYTWVIEGDIRDCFGSIDHSVLLGLLRRTIRDRQLLHVVRLMLKAGAMENLRYHETEEGTPQGGVASPLLANIYLNELDRFVASKFEADTPERRKYRARKGKILPCAVIRYADDFVVMVRGTAEQASALKEEIAAFLRGELHMELSAEKTLVTPIEAGFVFLGYEVKAITGKRDRKRKILLRPSKRAIGRYRQNIRTILVRLGRSQELGPMWRALNSYIDGWGRYFAGGVSSRMFAGLDQWTYGQVARMLHRRNRGRHHRSWRRTVGPHQVPLRSSIRADHRQRAGNRLGSWLDTEHRRALVLTALSFIPIRYVRQFGQYCPYRPKDRALLRARNRPYRSPSAIHASPWLQRTLRY
jgi:group II intron reverse transcriptase/maturase